MRREGWNRDFVACAMHTQSISLNWREQSFFWKFHKRMDGIKFFFGRDVDVTPLLYHSRNSAFQIFQIFIRNRGGNHKYRTYVHTQCGHTVAESRFDSIWFLKLNGRTLRCITVRLLVRLTLTNCCKVCEHLNKIRMLGMANLQFGIILSPAFCC